jgi:hypothetical protein
VAAFVAPPQTVLGAPIHRCLADLNASRASALLDFRSGARGRELAADARDVVLDGVAADAQLRRDVGVREPLMLEREHLELAPGEPDGLRPDAHDRRRLAEPLRASQTRSPAAVRRAASTIAPRSRAQCR